MAIAVTLVERTPYKLRYSCVANGQATAAPDSAVITNRDDGSSPDLRSDAADVTGQPIDQLVNTGVTSQAEARELLDGQGLTSFPADQEVARGHLTITPSNSSSDPDDESWSVDAQLGNTVDPGAPPAGSNGFAVIVVEGPNVNGARAIAQLEFDHSFDR